MVMKTDIGKFLKWFLIFSGYLEIAFGIMFMFFMDFFLKMLQLPSVPLFTQMSGWILFLMGYLLIYSAKDIEKYLIIPKVSITLRLVMSVFEIYNIFLFPQLASMLIPGALYDAFSAILTLILLSKCNFI